MAEDKLIKEYIKIRTESSRIHERASNVFAANGATHFGRILMPFRPYIVKAKGSKKWDIDGNEYIDYVMGHGSLLFGHCHDSLVKAANDQIVKGVHYGDNHELEVRWAELIQNMMPAAERIEFFACGQEANLMAIRIARIFSGRKKTLRFIENFHGWADEVVLPPTSPGVQADEVKLVPYDLDEVEKELATREYAILMTEGGGAHMTGQIPLESNFVRELPLLCKKYGTVWHLDEVVTGFRDAPGGYQSIVDVKPDLFSLGKIIGGGVAAGALAGRADIMEVLNSTTVPDRRVIHTGTWNANPLSSACGIASLELCQNGEPQRKANEMARYLRKQGNRIMKEKCVNGYLYGRSITHIYFGPFEFEPDDDIKPPTKDITKIMGMGNIKERLGFHLLHRGISTILGRLFVLSCVHTTADIDTTVTVLADSLDAMIAEGAFIK